MLRVYAALEAITGKPDESCVIAPSLSHVLNPVCGPLSSFAVEFRRVKDRDMDKTEKLWAVLPHAENTAEAFHAALSQAELMKANPKIRNDLGWCAMKCLFAINEAVLSMTGEDWKPSSHLQSFTALVRAAQYKKPTK